ncbi:ABHD17A [Symbiodinium sp. CCMP2592]|nr:ABHD17A [Symbiodinium sp. CCMP2592]CAE7302572.1 ABHD17A [Symbiodinium sp. CCMP2592]
MSIFLTKSSVNDMFVVATPRGVQLARSVRRTGQPWASEQALAEAIKGAKLRAPKAVPLPDVPLNVMPPAGLPVREQLASASPAVPAVLPAQAEESEVPAVMPPSVATAAPSSRPTLLLDRGDRRPVAASPMEIAGTDSPVTPGTSIDYSPSPASLPDGRVPDDTLLQDLRSRPGGDEPSSAVPPEPKRPRLLRSVMIRSARSSNAEELHHADETLELQFDAEVSESLQMYEDELSEQLHEQDEDYEVTAEGIPKCLIRDLSDHEPELSAEELFEADRQASLFEVARLGAKSVLVQVAGPLPGHRTLSTKFVVSWRQKCIGGEEVWLRRARLVAREFAFLDPHREGLFSPASSSIVTRIIPALFMQQRAAGWSMIAVDVADAYLTCSQGEPTVTSVKLGHQTLWFRLDKCLPGQRDGSSRWFGDFSGYLAEH